MLCSPISIVIPSHNPGPLLGEAIQSIRRQTGQFRISEIVVVDDSSTDPATLAEYRKLEGFPDLKIISNDRKKGPAGARNAGVAATTSPWICFLDADDVLTPGSIQARVEAMPHDDRPVFVGGDFVIWHGEGQFETDAFFRSRTRPRRHLNEAFESQRPLLIRRPYRQFLDAVLCNSASVLVSRASFENIGGFDERLKYCEDHHFFIRLAHVADFIFVPKVLFWYRQHGNNMTNCAGHPSALFREALILLRGAPELSGMRGAVTDRLACVEADVARWHRGEGRFFRAILSASRAVVYKPMHSEGWKELLAGLIMHQ